jgi:DNA polymerase-1
VKRTLLVDADIYCYKHAASNEEVYYFDGKDQPPTVDHDTEQACADAVADIESLKRELGADRIIICLTDRGNEFRKDFWPDYKGNRKGARKPTDLFTVEAHLAKSFEFYRRPRLEADDCMGILSTHPSIVPGEKIIVSEDKDMQTIPGLLFNPRKDEDVRKISKLQADRYHLAQTITGDQTDNYPGAPGIGPKSPEVAAVNAAATVKEMWVAVRAAFLRSAMRRMEAAGADHVNMVAVESQALVQARCARILRSSDWNFEKKQPILWMSPRVD